MAESGEVKQEKENTTEQYDFQCDVCSLDGINVEAVSVCVDCMDCLCKDCLVSHSTNEVFKTHQIVNQNKLPTNISYEIIHKLKTITICPLHEAQFEYACGAHSALACHVCIKKTHRQCQGIMKLQPSPTSLSIQLSKVEEFKAKLQTEKQKHKEYVKVVSDVLEKQNRLRSSILSKNQTYLKQFNSQEDKDLFGKVTRNAQSIVCSIEKINESQNKHVQMLNTILHLNDQQKATIVAKYVGLSQDEHKSSLVNTKDDVAFKTKLERNVKRLERLDNVTTQVIYIDKCSKGSDKGLGKTLKVIECPTVDAFTQTACTYTDAESQTNTGLTFGEDGAKSSDNLSTKCATCTASSDADIETSDNVTKNYGERHSYRRVLPLHYSDRSIEFVGTYKVSGPGELKCNIAGIAVLKSRKIVLIDELNYKIKLFDEAFNVLSEKKLYNCPITICTVDTDDDRVVVSLNTRRIETYVFTSNSIVSVRRFNLTLYCRGLYCVSKDSMAVLLSDKPYKKDGEKVPINSEDDTVEIQLRDIRDGRKIKSLATFDKRINSPINIVQAKRQTYFVGEENIIIALKEDGNRIWFYAGSQGSRLRGVMGMATDTEGNIYVCSQNSNSIHQVCSRNYMCSRVIIPHVPSPTEIAFDPDQERLIVASNNSNHVYVYKLPPH